MGKDILTSNQQKILGFVSKDKFITANFFMTGGTALSGFYLRHRFSEDLDFFSEDEFDAKQLLVSVSRLGDKLKLTKIDHQNLTGQDTFFLYFDEKSFVKVDFSFFPFKHVGSYKKIGN